MTPRLRVYPTLLDSFARMLASEDEGAEQEFLDRLNRVPTPETPAQARGKAFEGYVNAALAGLADSTPSGLVVLSEGTEVPGELLSEVVARVRGSVAQVPLSATIETRAGWVEVYGRADYLLGDTITDLKTTGTGYFLGKYLGSFQRPAYLAATEGTGVDRFRFLVADLRSMELYDEEYVRSEADEARMVAAIESLGEWLEANRARVTDGKIFGPG